MDLHACRGTGHEPHAPVDLRGLGVRGRNHGDVRPVLLPPLRHLGVSDSGKRPRSGVYVVYVAPYTNFTDVLVSSTVTVHT